MDVNSPEYQKRLRIRLCVFAYAYEYEADSLIDDHEFDRLCLLVNTDVKTDDISYDKWFKEEFSPYTGQWIRNHPERLLVQRQYLRLKEALVCRSI